MLYASAFSGVLGSAAVAAKLRRKLTLSTRAIEFQRQGFATEATSALIEWTLRDPRVKRIDAETFPHLIPSLGVMRRLGMTSLGAGSEEGTVRYGVTREAWRQALSAPNALGQP